MDTVKKMYFTNKKISIQDAITKPKATSYLIIQQQILLSLPPISAYVILEYQLVP